MATRRLMQGRRANDDSPQPARVRQQSSAPNRQRAFQSTALPPYELPACPLTPQARQELAQLNVNYDYTKYAKHLQSCKNAMSTNIADAFDRVADRKLIAEQQTNRRRKAGGNDDERTEEEILAIKAAKDLEVRVSELQARAEKAFRELVDFEDELNMNDTMMKDVIAKIPPPPQPQARQIQNGADSDEEAAPARVRVQGDIQVPEVPGVSTFDLLQKRRQEYRDGYNSKTMQNRYENTDYATFIRTVHTSRFGDEVPVPPARTWFTEDGEPAQAVSALAKRSAAVDEDSDDEVEISRATATLKCPLTLQYFTEPYSSKVCKHTFEKSAILEYYKTNAKYHDQVMGPRGRPHNPSGPKKAECPQAGCQKLLHPDDFYIDTIVMRQVKRAKADEAREEEEDDDESDDGGPRGTQNRPAAVGSDDEIEIEEDEGDRKRKAMKIKQERAQSRAPSHRPTQQTQEPMDLDDDDDEDEDDDDDEV